MNLRYLPESEGASHISEMKQMEQFCVFMAVQKQFRKIRLCPVHALGMEHDAAESACRGRLQFCEKRVPSLLRFCRLPGMQVC